MLTKLSQMPTIVQKLDQLDIWRAWGSPTADMIMLEYYEEQEAQRAAHTAQYWARVNGMSQSYPFIISDAVFTADAKLTGAWTEEATRRMNAHLLDTLIYGTSFYTVYSGDCGSKPNGVPDNYDPYYTWKVRL